MQPIFNHSLERDREHAGAGKGAAPAGHRASAILKVLVILFFNPINYLRQKMSVLLIVYLRDIPQKNDLFGSEYFR